MCIVRRDDAILFIHCLSARHYVSVLLFGMLTKLLENNLDEFLWAVECDTMSPTMYTCSLGEFDFSWCYFDWTDFQHRIKCFFLVETNDNENRLQWKWKKERAGVNETRCWTSKQHKSNVHKCLWYLQRIILKKLK